MIKKKPRSTARPVYREETPRKGISARKAPNNCIICCDAEYFKAESIKFNHIEFVICNNRPDCVTNACGAFRQL